LHPTAELVVGVGLVVVVVVEVVGAYGDIVAGEELVAHDVPQH